MRADFPQFLAEWLSNDTQISTIARVVEAWPSRLSTARALWPAVYVGIDETRWQIETYNNQLHGQHTVTVDILHGVADGPTQQAQVALAELADLIVRRLADPNWGRAEVLVAANLIEVEWVRDCWAEFYEPVGSLHLRIKVPVEEILE